MIIHRVVQPLPQLILKDFYLPPKETLCLLGCSVLSYVQLYGLYSASGRKESDTTEQLSLSV